MKHYPLSELDRYRNREMSFLTRLLCRWHLAGCERCRARLSRLETDELFLRDVKDSVAKMHIPENENAYRRLCDTFRETPEQHSSI